MRDLVLALIVFGSLPVILKWPFIGILMSAWLGYMNPHLLTWGFMFGKPVVQIVVLTTMLGMLLSKEQKRMIWSREIAVLLLFIVWMGITTTTAFYGDAAMKQFIKVIKIQILTFMALIMLTSRDKVHLFVWVIVLSLGFYGIKGGLFTIANGGSYRVQGPAGSFIGGNNELALALVMTVPLMRYLQLQAKRLLVRRGLGVAMVLTVLAAVGSQSRGALVALAVTGVIFWAKSRRKLAMAMSLGVAVVLAVAIMPSQWYERMSTIKTYEQDQSAMGRINAWQTAINIANDRLTGGGFETWGFSVFARYAPITDVRDVHSIYFEVLGEHGYIGLAIFLTLIFLTWRTCTAVIRTTRNDPTRVWARDLAAMIQVSLVGYMVGGAFLGMAYFDYFYHLVTLAVVVHRLSVYEPQREARQLQGEPGGSRHGVNGRVSQGIR